MIVPQSSMCTPDWKEIRMTLRMSVGHHCVDLGDDWEIYAASSLWY